MADSITFRSSFKGFNRQEVLEYISALLKEKEDLSAQVNTLTKLGEAKDAEIAELTRQLNVEKSKCDTCDIAKKAESSLGAAMLDAKRFSDSLVSDAKEHCATVFDVASVKADKASANAQTIVDVVKDALGNCNNSFSGLLSALSDIQQILSEFGEQLEENTDTEAKEDNFDANAENTAPAAPEFFAKPQVSTPVKPTAEEKPAPVFKAPEQVKKVEPSPVVPQPEKVTEQSEVKVIKEDTFVPSQTFIERKTEEKETVSPAHEKENVTVTPEPGFSFDASVFDANAVSVAPADEFVDAFDDAIGGEPTPASPIDEFDAPAPSASVDDIKPGNKVPEFDFPEDGFTIKVDLDD